MARIFKFPNCQNCKECSCSDGLGPPGSINSEAVEFILKELERLEDFLVNRSQRDIKGASILIIVDHFARNYCIKMIDLSTIKVYEDKNQRDHGLILGVKNLIKFIKQF